MLHMELVSQLHMHQSTWHNTVLPPKKEANKTNKNKKRQKRNKRKREKNGWTMNECMNGHSMYETVYGKWIERKHKKYFYYYKSSLWGNLTCCPEQVIWTEVGAEERGMTGVAVGGGEDVSTKHSKYAGLRRSMLTVSWLMSPVDVQSKILSAHLRTL